MLRSVAMPAEHGGWGLTLEPGILGLLLAPSAAALLLAVAALAAFVVRTPLRLLLIGRHRGHARPASTMGAARVRVARSVAVVEMTVLAAALVGAALLAAEPRWWLPGLIAAPLFVVALWFDMRSLSRHLVPEVVGSIAIASVAAMGALAGGSTWPVAVGAWLILCARICSSIPHVRAQIARIRGRSWSAGPTLVGDLAAVGVALAAVLLEPGYLAGAVAIVGLIIIQRLTLVRPPHRAAVLGVRQMVLGFTVVGIAALGIWLA